MKTILLALLATSSLLAGSAGAQLCQLADGFEPNDTCATAQGFSTVCQPGLTVSKTNADWYFIQIPPQMDLLIGIVVDDPMATLGIEGRGSCASVPNLVNTALPARYSHTISNPSNMTTLTEYIQVYVNNISVADCTSYTLDLRIVPITGGVCAADSLEPNNCCDSAAPLPFVANFLGSIRPGDPDWIKFEVPDGATMALSLDAVVSPGSVSLQLYDFCGTSPLMTDPNYIAATNISGFPKTYWLEIKHDGSTLNCVSYVLYQRSFQSFTGSCRALPANCTDCPCGNNAVGNIGGCLNSAGMGARLSGFGTPSVSTDSMNFRATDLPPGTFGVLISGDRIAPTNPSHPCFGQDGGLTSPSLDGLRCVVQGIIRHGGRPSDTNGDIGVTNNGWGPPAGPLGGLIAHGGFSAGQARHFQVFYRDLPSQQCMTGLNTTNALTAIIVP